MLKRLEATSLLDAPCGDAGWIARVDLGVRVIGIDIVPDLIERLCDRAARGEIIGDYHLADITQRCVAALRRHSVPRLPGAFLLRQYRARGRELPPLRRGWLITTTFPEWQQNRDCEDGDWRALNFERAPFDWGAPVELVNENCTEAGGGWRDKSLGVWRL